MEASRGHSRKESDDFSKLLSDNQELGVGGEDSMLDLSLEPSLSFSQPKSSLRCNSLFSLGLYFLRVCFKGYAHPVGAFLFQTIATLFPVLLGWIILHRDHNATGNWLIIDKSLESFQIPGHISSQHEDMLSVAQKQSKAFSEHLWKNSRRKRSAGLETEQQDRKYQRSPKWTLELVYLAEGENDSDRNIFTKERLEAIHRIEQRLVQQDGFSDFCWKMAGAERDIFLRDGCVPPISLIDFFYPSVYFKHVINDGQGKVNLTAESIKDTLKLLLSKPFTYWFVDGSFSSSNPKSKFLRAQIKFGYPLKEWKHHKIHDQHKAFNSFIVKYAEAVSKMSVENVRVLYGGQQVFDYEVNKTLWEDMHLALYTIVFVVAFLFVFTRFSPYLTICGFISIVTPIAMAYYLFRVISGVKSVGILSGISVFIIIGIGVDDVFVFVNTFRQAHSSISLESRLSRTLVTAGKSTFFTSFTTCVAFLANYFSEMPAIRYFGLFMALIVGSCWVTVFTIMPPALNMWHRYISRWEDIAFHFLFGWMNCSCRGSNSLPDDIVQFLSGTNKNCNQNQPAAPLEEFELSSRTQRTPLYMDDNDDDDPLLTLDNSSPSLSDSDLAMFDDPNGTFDQQTVPLMPGHISLEQRPSTLPHTCGVSLQSILYHYLALPIKKYPFVVLVAFSIVLGVSIFLDTRIQASTKPPAFFREDTNLQQMWNLKYNMSADKLKVDELSLDFMGDMAGRSNNADTPTQNPTKKKGTETNVLKSTKRSTPTPVTAGHRGGGIKTNFQNKPADKRKSTAPSSKPTPLPQATASRKPSHITKKTSATGIPTQGTKQTIPATKRKTKAPPPSRARPSKKREKVIKGDSRKKATASPDETITVPRCSQGCEPIAKPIVDSSATVYVILGLKAIDRSKIIRESVLTKKGDVIPDRAFTDLVKNEKYTFLKYACRLCKKLANNVELVQPGGADCFPGWMIDSFGGDLHKDPWTKDCKDIKLPTFSTGQSHAKLMIMSTPSGDYKNGTYWMKMAFESTVFAGKSSGERVQDFDKWNKFLKDELQTYPKGFQSAFQTSKEWVNTFTEVIAINSAIYGVVFSIVLCLGSVAIFTANAVLTLIVMITIVGVLTSVVAIFYLASWQLGAVEAVSLSILVGTSVDYCVHLVEGYILAGNAIPDLTTAKEIRGWRSLAAISHIGTAILSSAITTVVASIPLCLTTIQLFAKFGQILAINTVVSIFFTLTICVALLRLIAPVRFRPSGLKTLKALFIVLTVYGVGAAILFLINWKGVIIPGPSGKPLFPRP